MFSSSKKSEPLSPNANAAAQKFTDGIQAIAKEGLENGVPPAYVLGALAVVRLNVEYEITKLMMSAGEPAKK
jgi:hypothetical protein